MMKSRDRFGLSPARPTGPRASHEGVPLAGESGLRQAAASTGRGAMASMKSMTRGPSRRVVSGRLCCGGYALDDERHGVHQRSDSSDHTQRLALGWWRHDPSMTCRRAHRSCEGVRAAPRLQAFSEALVSASALTRRSSNRPALAHSARPRFASSRHRNSMGQRRNPQVASNRTA